jgi:BirA family transcriptional regulator, biotin operon repressor / biotin---[acetyl-CoA-carboxylase] ligase
LKLPLTIATSFNLFQGTKKNVNPRSPLNVQKPDFWKIPGQPRQIYYFNELVSTMDIARELAWGNCQCGTVIVAGRQTQGRGRMTRVWHSEEGGLYFTIVLRPDLPLNQAALICFAASFVMAQVLNRLFEIDARVKWPNDLLVQDRKIAGMLSQIEVQANRILFLNIGIGLNVNNTPVESAPESTSLKSILNRRVSRKEILFEFLNRLDERLNMPAGINTIIDDWKTLTITLGRMVKIITNQGAYEGVARDVDASGALILEREDGRLQTVLYGDCFHQ